MRRLLVLLMLAGLALSTGCSEQKVIPPKDVPGAPKGPPVGDQQGGSTQRNQTKAPPVKP